MNTSKTLLVTIATSCIALLGVALYLQLVENMYPCPLCVLQRYAFALVALLCIIALLLPAAARRFTAGVGILAALTGAGIAARHVWILANPDTSCGMDPWEVTLNTVLPARLFPVLFKANGMCSDPYDPIMGLSIPQWSLVWFTVFAIGLLYIVWSSRKPAERKVFGPR